MLVLLVGCAAERADFHPDDEIEGELRGDIGAPCRCYHGDIFSFTCDASVGPIRVDLPYFPAPPNLREAVLIHFFVEDRLMGFADGVASYSDVVIDDARDDSSTLRFRQLTIESAVAGAQHVCEYNDGVQGECVEGYQGFELRDVRMWCEELP